MQESSNSNIQQQLSESDPDYNITLTAENLSEMRQAIVHSMEVDNPTINMNVNHSTASSGYFSDNSQQQRPNFYIDSTSSCSTGCLGLESSLGIRMQNVQSNCQSCFDNINNVTMSREVHNAIGTKHVFTVKPTKNFYYQNDKIKKMPFVSNDKPQQCIVQNTTQLQISQQNKPNNFQNSIPNILSNNIINQCCCNNVNSQHQSNNFIMNHSTQMISPSGSKNDLNAKNKSENVFFIESTPIRSSITQSDGQLDNSNFIYDENIHELNNFNDNDNMRIGMSKSQSYPYVFQAILSNQQMQQQNQDYQQNFYHQDSQSFNFQDSNKNIQQQIYDFSIQQQQFLFNNQN